MTERHTFKHKLIKMFGGEYDVPNSDMTLYYPGTIPFWIDVKWWHFKQNIKRSRYRVRIWWIKLLYKLM